MGSVLATPKSSHQWDPVFDRLVEIENSLREVFSAEVSLFNRIREVKLSMEWKNCMANLKAVLVHLKMSNQVDEYYIRDKSMALNKHQSEYEMWRHAWTSRLPNRMAKPLLEEYEEFP